MFFFRLLCTVVSILCLTSCLKVTGEAKDPFDIAHGEQPIGVSQLNFFKNNSETDAQVTSTAPVGSNNLESTDELVPVPDTTSSAANQKFDLEFEKWKSERNNGSKEYQEFREYLEYKEWLEYQKAQNN